MKSFRIAAALATVLWQATPAGALAAGKELLVAEPGHNVGYLPLYIAIQKGYFAEHGLDVKILTMESGSAHTNAVLSGQAFAFIGGPEHNAFAKLKGGELRSVVNVVNRGNVYYMAPPGKEPKPGEDMASYFKGKIIAVSAYGGTPNSITRYLLKKWNLNDKTDVTLQELPTSAVPATINRRRRRACDHAGHQAGLLDRTFLQDPEGTRALCLFHHQHPAGFNPEGSRHGAEVRRRRDARHRVHLCASG